MKKSIICTLLTLSLNLQATYLIEHESEPISIEKVGSLFAISHTAIINLPEPEKEYIKGRLRIEAFKTVISWKKATSESLQFITPLEEFQEKLRNQATMIKQCQLPRSERKAVDQVILPLQTGITQLAQSCHTDHSAQKYLTVLLWENLLEAFEK